MIVQTLCLLIWAAISRSILRLNSLWALCPSCMTPLDLSQGTNIILLVLKQTPRISQLGNFAKPLQNYRTIRINLEMINEPSSLSFIWRIIRIIIRRCESWNRPQQNSITESLKPCKFDWEFILDMQPEQMITKTRVSQSVSSETSCEPHTGNTEHYTLSILYSIHI